MSLLVTLPDGRTLLGYGYDVPAEGTVRVYEPGRSPAEVSVADTTSIVVLPMGSGCYSCGATFRQRGERTSHCSGCHQTFEGLTLFDAHFVDTDTGRSCKRASTMKWRGHKLRLVEGTWRGPAMDRDRFMRGDS